MPPRRVLCHNTHSTAGLSSRARQPTAVDTVVQPAITKAATSSQSLLATVLRIRGDSKAPIISPIANHTAPALPTAGGAPGSLTMTRRRQRDVVITAHSQRVRTTKMFTYGDADALLHPHGPGWPS